VPSSAGSPSETFKFMGMLGLWPLALLVWLAAVGCASHGQDTDAGFQPEPEPADAEVAAPCASAGTDGSDTSSVCATSPALLVTPQLQEAVHDLRRLGLANAMREVGHGRVSLALGETALERHVPLAYHLERLYRSYRAAYDYGDVVALELWYHGQQVGTYTSQGLLLR
jgi:hypothetical protein